MRDSLSLKRPHSLCTSHGRTIAFGLVACLFCLMLLPSEALAMETAKYTARPNGETGSTVYGGTETRITWEGQASPDEALKEIDLVLPEGTAFNTDDARVTLLSGDNNMDRTVLDAEISADGDTFRAKFPEATPPGGYFRIEIYGVNYPASGGDMPLTGMVVSEGGQSTFDAPSISVVGITPIDQLSNYLANQEWVQAWNSNKFLRLFFNPSIIVSSIPLVFEGFLFAIAIVAISFPIAIPIGLLLSLMRMSKLRILRGLGSLYVNVVRGTPLFLQIYIAFFGLPLAGISIPPFPLGVVVLSMNSAAYMCEIFRAGIQSIPHGQTEAARSLGMNGAQTMIFVIIPQTVRRVIPTLTSEFILLYKDTSMLAAVGVMEMVYDAKMIVANTGSITPYIVAACFYLIITIPLAKLVGRLERRLDGISAPKKRKKKQNLVAEGLAGGADPHPAATYQHIHGLDSAGVTGFTTDALMSQPMIKHAPSTPPQVKHGSLAGRAWKKERGDKHDSSK